MIAGVYARKTNRPKKKGKRQPTEHEEVQSSVRLQIDRAREFAKRKGWAFDPRYEWHDDGVSGELFGDKRPGFQRMLTYVLDERKRQRGGRLDVLIVSEESRLGREQTETNYRLKQIVAAGVRVFCWGDSPEHGREIRMGTAMEKFSQGVAAFRDEAEVERISQRVSSALGDRFERGEPVGGRCYGYRDGKVAADEARIVRRIFRLRAEGKGLLQIAKELRDDGVKTARAGLPNRFNQKSTGLWHPSQVRVILRNERYRGVVKYAGAERRDESLRIVDDRLWKRVEAANKVAREATWRSADGRHIRSRPPSGKHAITRFVACGVCVAAGRPGGMSLRTVPVDGRRYEYLVCSRWRNYGPKGCPNAARLSLRKAEERILAGFERALVAQGIVNAVERLRAEGRKDVDAAAVKREIAQIDEQKRRLVEEYARGEIEEVRRAIADRNARREHLEGLLIGARGSAASQAASARFRKELEEVMTDWRAHLKKNPQTGQVVLGKVLGASKIVLTPPRRKGDRWAFKAPVNYARIVDEVADDLRLVTRSGMRWSLWGKGSSSAKDKSNPGR